ncbi:hypothetical protein DICVIV_04031 [Dictyocaulus viviparus]|uniref:Uncharacterized protein n=1 Tax=Dictyocaulus viviparus TaxID=29172 RepID=A0A0D8Y125_DICVI|nr:hypothetical protein DICVIV_04031 [Dictyocaulus viviparus]
MVMGKNGGFNVDRERYQPLVQRHYARLQTVIALSVMLRLQNQLDAEIPRFLVMTVVVTHYIRQVQPRRVIDPILSCTH